MAHTRINIQPQMTQFLVQHLQAFASDPVVICDIGARGGIEHHWHCYGQQARFIGFDPDSQECNRLNQEFADKNYQLYPVALGKQKETKTFFICHYPGGSSFYPANRSFLDRFPSEHSEDLEVVNTAEITTINLDLFVQQKDISSLDFIKIDVEGSELHILQGAENILKQSVLGVSLEVLFHSSLRSQPTFSEIDLFLNSLGFHLFDLSIYRHARKTLSLPSGEFGNTEIGQVLWGQALYFKDFVGEIKSDSITMEWDKNKILKLASLMEIFCLPDCAIEVIQMGESRWKFDSKPLIDRLIPA
jgi:FkbM family methyltransferase